MAAIDVRRLRKQFGPVTALVDVSLAVAQGDPGNAAAVRFVAVDSSSNGFTIHMTEPVAADTPLAWFLVD